MIVPRFYEDLGVLHENAMPPRSYYIPASRRMNRLVEHREDSDRIQFLNGIWKFKYFKSIYDMKEEFFRVGFDASEFDDVPVPSAWQMLGYDWHQYTNFRYPFPFDPPYVPQDNPCAAYIYAFEYHKDVCAPQAFLNFEGVDSCFYVWLNGKYIGYSQVSHATAEFDITESIIEGKNVLAVLVLKWCDGSYLEDQDKFRISGIFRDVYLLKRPCNAIFDYRITTQIKENDALIHLDLKFFRDTEIKILLESKEGRKLCSESISSDGSVTLHIKNPILWNAENPYLYSLVMESKYETIEDYIGIRTIEVKDKILYFNGQNIKFWGVNRHDFDPVSGPVISMDQLIADLKLMKQHNFNAIRSSHYPNAPYFYQLCDKYGFMVINEADIEAHGAFSLYREEDTDYNRFKRWNEDIADNPRWEEAILDRVRLMVERDKNRPCIVIWSMGNESAYGCNFEKALKWTKEFDPHRLTHYESARYRNYDVIYKYEHLDLYSRMYPKLSEIREYLDKDGSKPFLLVEYCHSMGNSLGDLEDYFQIMQKQDILCGGFIWEWCDHAIYKGIAENAKAMYHYGGDHEENVHDGNFCVDGLVYPDRTVHTNLLEYKNVHRPARILSYDAEKGELVLHNYMDFDDLADYVEGEYEISCDGEIVEKGKLNLPSIAPHHSEKILFKVCFPDKGKSFLKVIYILKKNMELIPKKHILGFDEIILPNKDMRNQKLLCRFKKDDQNAAMRVEEDACYIRIYGENFCYIYDKRIGMFSSLEFGGISYLAQDMEINIWRAPIDNDMYIKMDWKKAHYHEAFVRAYTADFKQEKNAIKITSRASVCADTVQRILNLQMTWIIDGRGGIASRIEVEKGPEFPTLPRFGVRLFLNRALEQVSYYGMGPYESYRDKHRASFHGIFHSTVQNMHEDYIRPQENGSHFDCDYVELSSDSFGLLAASETPFSFNASLYAQETLEEAKHHYELVESGNTILCLDYAQNGIGSNSCGPDLADEYRLDDTSFKFEFTLIPFIRK